MNLNFWRKKKPEEFKVEGKIELGEYSYVHPDSFVRCWHEPCTVKVGRYSSIAKCQFVYDGNHNPYFASTFPFKELGYCNTAPLNSLKKPPPEVGHDVWIGDDAVIYSGVKVGDGAVIAGQAVVTKDVPAYAIVAGNPAKIIKYRFEKDVIDRLTKIQWWFMDHDFICKELAPVMHDVPLFLQRAEDYAREEQALNDVLSIKTY